MEMMAAAHDAGVNFFDNAEAYAKGKSEEIMGEALKKLGWRRSSYLVSTKLFWGLNEGINEKDTLNRKYLLEAIEGSLKRFQLDHIDLVFAHRPDPHTPIEETVWAMHNIVESGKAFYWGTSEWPAGDILAAIELAERHHLHKPVMEQSQYNMFHRERFEVEYAAFVCRLRLRLHNLEPAGIRPVDRQVQQGHPGRFARNTSALRMAERERYRPGQAGESRTAARRGR